MRLISEKILFTPMERVYSTVNRVHSHIRFDTESEFLIVCRGLGLRSQRIYGVRRGNDWIGNLR